VPARIAGSDLNRSVVVVVSQRGIGRMNDRRMPVSVCGRTVVMLGMIVIGVVVHVPGRRHHPRREEDVNENESRQPVHGASLLRRPHPSSRISDPEAFTSWAA
jgi:hypothetical protein